MTGSAPALDFVVVGAAKAGTTTLFNLLRTHPELYLPPGKELPYFASPRHSYYDSPAEFFTEAFRDRGPRQLCGTVTPQYLFGWLLDPQSAQSMTDAGSPETTIPRRIRDAYPDARLIAILRDPVARARSHHRMLTMKSHERRPFDLAVEELLEPEILSKTRARADVNNSYIVLGEYARLLQGYLDVFPREQLLVLFHEDLERDPAAVCERAFAFLGVDPEFHPPDLGRRHNEGTSRRRFAWLDLTRWQRAAARSRALGWLWRRLPRSLRRRALRLFDLTAWRLFLWNRVPGDPQANPDPTSPETLARLCAHYRDDGQQLKALLGVVPPWQEQEADARPIGTG